MFNKMIVNSDILNSHLSAIADKIRTVTNKTDSISYPDGFIAEFQLIKSIIHSDLKSGIAEITNKTISVLDNEFITKVGGEFQKGNTNLITVNLPNVTSLPDSCFNGCNNITTLNLPKVTTIGGGSLALLYKITQIYLPSVTTNNSWGWTFQGLKKCTRIYFPKLAGSIQSNDFTSCSVLDTLILGHSAVCPLAATSAFNNTPIAKGTGYVYVPRDLVDAYKTAENWSTFANQIRAIEDYPSVLEGWT